MDITVSKYIDGRDADQFYAESMPTNLETLHAVCNDVNSLFHVLQLF
jgi:hypothetical protein